jgi:arylsulfatase A-like enzyme
MTFADASTGQPNILLITDDQHRWDFFDNRTVPALRTPTLDRLRREGATLANTITNCPICIPTRFTWAYGLYASQAAAGLTKNRHDWPTDLPSLPQALTGAWYRTALVGKLHSREGLRPIDLLAEEAVTRARGFQDVFEVSGKELAYWYDCRWTAHLHEIGALERYRAEVRESCWAFGGHERGVPTFLEAGDSVDGFIGRQARHWLESYDSNAPFFLHASFCGPHNPYDPVRDYAYDPDDMPPPPGLTDPAAIRHWQRMQALYCGLITQVDEEAGRLLDVLDARGWAANTLVLFATDHGDMMGHHNRGTKGPPYDTSIRTPYLLRWPGVVPAGRVLEAMVEAVDLPATLLHAAGLGDDATAHLPGSLGRSVLDYAAGRRETHRAWAFSEFCVGDPGGWRLVRQRDWKYVRRPAGDLLFDLRDDPWEFTNRIDDPAHADRVSRMRGQLIDSLATAPDRQQRSA